MHSGARSFKRCRFKELSVWQEECNDTANYSAIMYSRAFQMHRLLLELALCSQL